MHFYIPPEKKTARRDLGHCVARRKEHLLFPAGMLISWGQGDRSMIRNLEEYIDRKEASHRRAGVARGESLGSALCRRPVPVIGEPVLRLFKGVKAPRLRPENNLTASK